MAGSPRSTCAAAHERDRRILRRLQYRMIERHGEMERYISGNAGGGPKWFISPDKIDRTYFLASIGGYDIYDLDAYSEGNSSPFLMIKSNEGGDYITTDHPVNYIPGFFSTEF